MRAVPVAPRGRLIAVEGAVGPDLAVAAKRLARAQRDADSGVSAWDASGIFTELAATDPEIRAPCARTLTLLYAADLAFRLRWQIRPALAGGHSVVAAPYVESALAVGLAAGLPKRWLADLFRFAPTPHICYHLRHSGGHGRVTAGRGYVTFACTAIAANGGPINPARLHKLTTEHLARLERIGRCRRLARAGAVARAPSSPSGARTRARRRRLR
ncbi:MAG: hypothetical protein HY654_08790 [Acidobacteria bacterium]|nr:hypothetical protein [Acidobacteriota bacterium]